MAYAFGLGRLLQVAAASALERWVNCLKSALNLLQMGGLIASLRVFVLSSARVALRGVRDPRCWETPKIQRGPLFWSGGLWFLLPHHDQPRAISCA